MNDVVHCQLSYLLQKGHILKYLQMLPRAHPRGPKGI